MSERQETIATPAQGTAAPATQVSDENTKVSVKLVGDALKSEAVLSKVTPELSIIFMPTKNFDPETIQDVVTVSIDGQEKRVTTFNPFDEVPLASTAGIVKVPGLFRTGFLPAMKSLIDLSKEKVIRIGTAKENDSLYQGIAAGLCADFNRYMPNVPGMQKRVQLNKKGEGAFREYILNMFIFYTWPGAVVEDVANAIFSLEGALSKSGITLPVSASIAVRMEESFLLSQPTFTRGKGDKQKTYNISEEFVFTTSLEKNNPALPSTKKTTMELLGNVGEEVHPTILLNRKIV